MKTQFFFLLISGNGEDYVYDDEDYDLDEESETHADDENNIYKDVMKHARLVDRLTLLFRYDESFVMFMFSNKYPLKIEKHVL